MATSAEIGASNSRYTGDAGLGGGSFGAVKLDTRPIEDLAKYTMLYNRAEYDQRQKDVDAKILELAKLAPISLNDLRGKDKEEMTKRWVKLQEKAADYARKTPKSQQEKIEQQLEWQNELNAFNNDYQSGKARSIKYVKEVDDLGKTINNAATKEAYIKQLDDAFNKTPISELFGSVNKYQTSTLEIPKPIPTETNTVDIGGNENLNVKGKIFLPSVNAKAANQTLFGLDNLYKKDLTGLSEAQVSQANIQETIESEAKLWSDMAIPFNKVLSDPKYYIKDDQGNVSFDEDKFRTDNASNSIIMRPFNALKDLNAYSLKGKANTGVFEDKGVRHKLPSNVSPDDFNAGIIDFSSGNIKPEQLILAGMYAQYEGDKFDKNIQLTDNAINEEGIKIQKGQLGVSWYNAKTSRINATKPSGSSSTTDPKTIDTPAILFGEHINRIKTFFDKNKSAPGLAVPYASLDNKTIKALNIEDGQRVVYSKDGGYVIESGSGNEWTRVRVGTVEDLKQGFINTVKAGQSGDGTQSEGFQENAEQGFNSIFGTSSGTVIFNNWGKPQQETTAPAPSNNDAALTDAEYFLKYKKQKPK